METGKFYSPTPVRMRKIGDAILYSTSTLSVLMMGSPLNDNQIKWAVFGLAVIGVAGKTITNMFKDETNKPE